MAVIACLVRLPLVYTFALVAELTLPLADFCSLAYLERYPGAKGIFLLRFWPIISSN